MLRWSVVFGTLLLWLSLTAVNPTPVLARTIKDLGTSGHGFSSNCPPNSGTCLSLQLRGTATLNGTDASGHAITVSISFSDWDQNPSNGKPNVLIDVVLTGQDPTLNLQRLTVAGVLPNPTYVSCQTTTPVATPCVLVPMPDEDNVQEPGAIAGSDGKNTQWDFGTSAFSDPFPGDRFVDMQTECPSSDCPVPLGLGEAILAIDGTFSGNNLSLNANNYLAIVTDDSDHIFTLGGLSSPPAAASATNNTKATAKAISGTHFQDFEDTSQLSPSEDAVGDMQPATGFTPPPAPSCNPPNGVTFQTDTRVFRAAWYSYTAPSNGSVAISTAKSRYDTLLYVLRGNTEIACNDDSGNLLQSAVSFPVTAGTAYSVVVIETPPEQTQDFSGATSGNIGYPLSTDGALYFDFQFTPAAPTASLSAPTLDFGGQFINTPSGAQTVSLTNNGPTDLTITAIAASGDYSPNSTCPASLPANQSCDINVVFTPTNTGTRNGTLTVTDNATNSPQTTNLTGSGQDFQITITPPSTTTINAGQQISTTITLAPASGFDSSVSLSCAVTPVVSLGPTCGFSPSTLPTGSGTSTLTISTTGPAAALRTPLGFETKLLYALICPLCLGFIAKGVHGKIRGGRTVVFRLSCLLLICAAAFAWGCGGGSSGPPPPPPAHTPSGNYTATLTASGGGGTRTTNLMFTVR